MQARIERYLHSYITVKWSQRLGIKKKTYFLLCSFFWKNAVADDDDIVCYLTMSSSSSYSSSSECCTTIGMMGTVLYLTLLGSKGSTTTCSVPLISARQYGHPWPSDSWKQNQTLHFARVNYCSDIKPIKMDVISPHWFTTTYHPRIQTRST